MDKTLKSAIFVCMQNGFQWLQGVQSINTERASLQQDYYLSTILFQLLQSMNYSFFVGLIHVSL